MGKPLGLSRMDSQKRQNRFLSSHGDLGKVKSRGSSFTEEHFHTCKISPISLLQAVFPFGELWTDVGSSSCSGIAVPAKGAAMVKSRFVPLSQTVVFSQESLLYLLQAFGSRGSLGKQNIC